MTLDTPIEALSRVGKQTAARLKRMGITTVRDLLFHFPNRYEDWSAQSNIAHLKPFMNASLQVTIQEISNRKTPRKRMTLTEALVSDETGSLQVIWFNQPFLVKNLTPGMKLSLSGKVDLQGRSLIMKSPKYEVLRADSETVHTGRILPIYPLSMNVTQKQVQFLMSQAMPAAMHIQDPLPEEIRTKHEFPSMNEALQFIHYPQDQQQIQRAQKRFAFEELFYLQLQVAQLRQSNEQQAAPALKFFEEEVREFVQKLPFELTADQKKAAWHIFLDTQKSVPMNRLLQGDVGSGKTVISALAMYNVALNGFQSVAMAPTEVLAHQHFETFKRLFDDTGFPVLLLTRSKRVLFNDGKTESVTKYEASKMVAKGDCAIVVGTHALLQPEIMFRQLGLAIIDEQHRFGVEQRKQLRENSQAELLPHLLSMTATPIPRTLKLALYGDLEVSSIRQKPKDRLPIITRVVRTDERQKAYDFIREQLQAKRQAYVVCPLIEESDKMEAASVQQETTRMKKVFKEFVVHPLHGKLKSDEKEHIMSEFKAGQIDILVSTTVIEVGVDVPNATIMIIEGPERFGLSQLHQIRGRVGRGKEQSHCFLFASQPIPAVFDRLQRFVRCRDGFEVAELDLHMRGAGEMLGTRQSGVQELRYLNLNNAAFIEEVQQTAKQFLAEHQVEDFPLLAAHVQRLNDKIHLE